MNLDELSFQYNIHPYLYRNPCNLSFILPRPGFCAEKMTSFLPSSYGSSLSARLSELAMFRSALVAAVAGSAAAFAPTAPLAGRATTRAVGTFLCCALPCSPPRLRVLPENPACTGRGLADARPLCPDWGPRPFAPLSHAMFPATKSVHGCRN